MRRIEFALPPALSDQSAAETHQSKNFPRLMTTVCALAAIVCSLGVFALDLSATEPVEDANQLSVNTPANLEFFEKQVRPLLVERCYECHAGAEKNGGLKLEARDQLLTGGDSGAAVVPGDPDKSLLIEPVRYKNRELQMPPKKALSAEQVAVLEEWVRRGLPDPRTAAAAAAPAVKGMSLEEGRKFWAFQPIGDPELPANANAAWVQSPIDAFILAELESKQLSPAPKADKRTWLRRATFDLIGLPPTADEIDAFVSDDSPGAYDRVIERLLESPHYGVRWGRHWLDVARYADSNGLDENLAYGTAWRYRDYVVDSFNHDKPYDRFVMEQVAGDLLPDQSPETHIATGFLVLGAKVLAEPDREKLTMDTIDEQIDTLGKAFLGMTLGCARCHDHKFDPISQADYYGLAAIFKSTKTFGDSNTGAIKHWHEINLATAEEKEKLKAIDAAIAEKQKAASTFKANAMSKIRDAARQAAVDYLCACLEFDLDTSLNEILPIAQKLNLHPRILHQCRRHLEFHGDEPFFAKWHEFKQLDREAAATAVRDYYEPLLSKAREWAEAKKKDPKLAAIEDADVKTAHAELFNNSGFLTVPPKVGYGFDEQTLAEYNRLAEAARLEESFAPDMPSAMSVSEAKTTLATIPIHIRGSHRNLGENIRRAFPKVMQLASVDPILPRSQSGRLQLAQWLASSQHPLTARVYVNRIWRWHFGAGLIGSTENFGVLGDRPTHPQLLEWLARNFIESCWSTKQLHRLIMRSSAYQMASLHPEADKCAAVDPENRLLWQFRVQRLDAEQVRDSLLYVTGRLDERIGGKCVPLRNRQFVFDHTSIDHTKYDSLRRSLYLPVIRNNLYTMFEQFDFPDPTMPTGSRHSTTVAPQSLLLMNSDLVIDSAEQLACELVAQKTDDVQRAQAAVRRILGRQASDQEVESIRSFVTGVEAGESGLEMKQSWTLVCQSLMISNEFFMIR